MCVLMDYANPHVSGWLDTFISFCGFNVFVGIRSSVKHYRPRYFSRVDNNDLYLYFHKDIRVRNFFHRKVKTADIILSLGMFNLDFLKMVLHCSKSSRFYILSEPFNSKKKDLFRYLVRVVYVRLITLFVAENRFIFLTIGGLVVKNDYRSLGRFEKSKFLIFGYFPRLPFGNVKRFELNEPIKFLYVGQLIPRKGIDILMKLINYLELNFENWTFTVIGSGEMETEFREFSNSRLKIRFLGLVTEERILNDEYRSASVFFLPSYFDGWGAVVNEALSFSCSLLLSEKVVSSLFLLANDRNGYSFDPYSMASLFEKVNNYFNNSGVLECHYGNSYKLYQDTWNHENASRTLFTLMTQAGFASKSILLTEIV